ncbi:hypothetical protein OX283_003520 [Flavobacterium sp. SUN052]|uniref:hypothetical protein n=1 Tax=Flavobacterium sp. SUN052 TaxID=3002441 RepID=UPI00237E58DF|nr:hypothetical protein [Flavobacterium sp. SUN052]MEC4003712.1 hypothetical protein [Flavobacterium sp. SUN052]
MTELEKFQELKQKVLLKYQEQYPYFQGNWKSFSSQDIQNLIGLIEVNCKQTISEKWIYTHLKPETNSKIPRKDMLNILSEFVGFSGWDEFTFDEKIIKKNEVIQSKKSKISKKWFLLLLLIPLVLLIVFLNKKEDSKPNTIQLNNQFTNEKVNSDEVKVYQVKDSVKEELELKEGKVQVSNNGNKKTKLVIQSPFYHSRTVVINQNSNKVAPKIDLKPDDYAMMLKAFMLSDIKDWQTRKEQLNKILSDNLEVIVMLKDDLGAEYFNKSEFSQKLIVPTASLKKMKIVEIKNDATDKIQFIRIKQE